MERVIVDRYGGPEVLHVVQDDIPQPGPGEVRVKVLAAGVSFTDALLRAGSYLGVPKPPFTPGYELVGVVEALGPGASRLRVDQRICGLTVWGAYAERVCLPETEAVPVPDDLDPAQEVALVLAYGTAYQLLHRTALVARGETVLVHGAAGRVGTAVLELGAHAGLRLYGTASARDAAIVEGLGATAIDYRGEDFVARVRQDTGDGVDVVLDGLGGAVSLRSFRALRPGGRLIVFGHIGAMVGGHRSWRSWAEWYATTAAVGLRGLLDRDRTVRGYRIQKLHHGQEWIPVGVGRAPLVGGGPRDSERFGEDLRTLVQLLRAGTIRPVVAQRLPLSQARHAHELLQSSASVGKLVLVPDHRQEA